MTYTYEMSRSVPNSFANPAIEEWRGDVTNNITSAVMTTRVGQAPTIRLDTVGLPLASLALDTWRWTLLTIRENNTIVFVGRMIHTTLRYQSNTSLTELVFAGQQDYLNDSSLPVLNLTTTPWGALLSSVTQYASTLGAVGDLEYRNMTITTPSPLPNTVNDIRTWRFVNGETLAERIDVITETVNMAVRVDPLGERNGTLAFDNRRNDLNWVYGDGSVAGDRRIIALELDVTNEGEPTHFRLQGAVVNESTGQRLESPVNNGQTIARATGAPAAVVRRTINKVFDEITDVNQLTALISMMPLNVDGWSFDGAIPSGQATVEVLGGVSEIMQVSGLGVVFRMKDYLDQGESLVPGRVVGARYDLFEGNIAELRLGTLRRRRTF